MASDFQPVGHVSELNLYPLKSARPVPLEVLLCSPEKAAHNETVADRYFMVFTSEDHRMVTGRQNPKVMAIIPRLNGSKISFTVEGVTSELVLDINDLNKKPLYMNDVRLFNLYLKGVDCGDEAADWLSRYMGPGHRLLYSAPPIQKRQQNDDMPVFKEYVKDVKDNALLAYHDTAAFHLCTKQSLADLNTRLENPVDMIRFRPNFVVESSCEAYDEDNWLDIKIGNTLFRKFKSGDRCVMPTIDPYQCVRDKTNEPLKTLKSYRNKIKGLGPLFGIDLVVDKLGSVKVGDPIYATRSPPQE